jgi:nitroreductase
MDLHRNRKNTSSLTDGKKLSKNTLNIRMIYLQTWNNQAREADFMKTNPVIQNLLAHKSIRNYSDETPSEDVVQTIVRASQQAPFAYQAYSILLSRNRKRNPWHAPLLFTICIDYYKFEQIMKKRKWQPFQNDLALLIFGIQDAAYAAQSLVIAGQSLGLGSCFLGSAMYRADKIAKEYKLPKKVFPFVQLAMGYPAEDPPPRPRYPADFILFEDKYPKLDENKISKAMREMDQGYLTQDYYRKGKYMIALEGKRRETFTFDNYSWTEHICRKIGQWDPDPKTLLEQLEKRGFNLTGKN